MTRKVPIWSYEIVLLKEEIERLENKYVLNRSVNRENRTHSSSALLQLRKPGKPCMTRKVLIWSYETVLLKEENEKLVTDTCQTVQ